MPEALTLLLALLVSVVAWRWVSPLYILVLLGMILAASGLLGTNPIAWLPLLALGSGLILSGRSTPATLPPRPGASPKPPPLLPQGASSLDRKYELIEKVGVGGMATVYKARSRSDGRIVALKIPQDRYLSDPRFVKRFHREADVLAHLNHPGIVRVFDHGNEGETHFIAMEFLDGEGLDRLLESRKLALVTIVEIMRLVADALRHIHAQGIIHRDIKPGNIMVSARAITPDGLIQPNGVRLMDFGIASGREFARLTITGARIGTPVYMSPEQARGQRISPKSDVYSLGIVFYEALMGKPPFEGGYESIIHQQMFQPPTPPRQLNTSIPPVLSELVVKMLDKNAEKRPGLDQVIQILGSNWQEEQGLGLATYLAIAVDAKKGSVRLLEPEGSLVRLWSGIGTSAGMFPSAPLSICADQESNLWLSFFEFASSETRLIHCLDREGQPTLALGPHGLRIGSFVNPISLASHGTSVFILDGETSQITQLNLVGQAQQRFGGTGPGRGLFSQPRKIAAGENGLYVLDQGNQLVQHLSLEGKFIDQFPLPYPAETQTSGGLGLDPQGNPLIFNPQKQVIEPLIPGGNTLPAVSVPFEEGENLEAMVELVCIGQVIYTVRQGSSKIRRYQPGVGLLPPLEAYAPVLALATWPNPQRK